MIDVRLGIGYIDYDLDTGCTGSLRYGRAGAHEKVDFHYRFASVPPQHVPLPEAQTSFALLPRAYRHGRLMLQFMHWKGQSTRVIEA